MRVDIRCLGLLTAVLLPVASGQQGWFVGPQQSVTGQAGPVTNETGPKTRRTLSGSVVNSVTGEPIRKALVRTMGVEQRFAFTGADGRFQIEGVAEGPTSVSAQKPGFLDSAGPGVRPEPFTTSASSSDILIKLTPEARVRGRVVDSEGEPVEGLAIQMTLQTIVEGRKQWQPTQSATTNEDGTYRIDNLASGVYVAQISSHPVFPAYWNGGQQNTEVYPPQFYPNATDFNTAQRLELKAGQELELDMTLKPVRGINITGTVSGGGPNGWWVQCDNADGLQAAVAIQQDGRTGKFVLMDVPAGSWMLHFQSNDTQGHVFSAEQAIEANGSDITGLHVQLQPLEPIPVRIVNGSSPQQNLLVQLIPDSRRWNGGRFQAFPQNGETTEGSLAFQGLQPGTYKLDAQNMGGGEGCVASATSGSTDLLRESLTVTPGSQPAPIEITLTNDCAQISGKIHSSQTHVIGYVILAAESGLREPRVMPVREDGTFSFTNLPPGEYRTYAFSEIADLEYANPEAMRDYPAQEIAAGPNEKKEIEIELMERSKP